jgi:endonuclease G
VAQPFLTVPFEAQENKGKVPFRSCALAFAELGRPDRAMATFINLDELYPNQIFTVLIWGSDRSKFGDPEETYRNKHICVTGKISDYKGVPEIIAYEPSQITVR